MTVCSRRSVLAAAVAFLPGAQLAAAGLADNAAGSWREPPYSSPLNEQFAAVSYYCVGCGHALFDASNKYFTSSGWPTFSGCYVDAIDRLAALLSADASSISCAHCNANLGDFFRDGPLPSGERYCVNGSALRFRANGSNTSMTSGATTVDT